MSESIVFKMTKPGHTEIWVHWGKVKSYEKKGWTLEYEGANPVSKVGKEST